MQFSDEQISALIKLFGSQKFFHWYCEDGGIFNEWIQDSEETHEKEVIDSLKKMLEIHSGS